VVMEIDHDLTLEIGSPRTDLIGAARSTRT
jgi:hypothetical protein